MSTNPRYVTRPPKVGKRRERKYPPAVGKPIQPSDDQQFKAIFGAPKKRSISQTGVAMRPTATDKRKQSEELARHTAEFLANGGVIDQVGTERREETKGGGKQRSEAGKMAIKNDQYARVNAKRGRK